MAAKKDQPEIPSDVKELIEPEIPSDVKELRGKIIQILNNTCDGMLKHGRSVSGETDIQTIKTLCDSYELLRSSI